MNKMNCEEFEVKPLLLSVPLVKESLRCLLHTILFSRSIGGDVPIEPESVKSEILGVSYCRANQSGSGPDLGQIVENKLSDFIQKLETCESLILTLSFFLPRQGKRTLWDLLSQPFDDKAVFERWKIQVDLVDKSSATPIGKCLEAEEFRLIESAAVQTKERVFYIIKRINERMDHLPAPPLEQSAYHFDIAFSASSGKSSYASSPTSTSSIWSPKAIAQSIRSIPFIT